MFSSRRLLVETTAKGLAKQGGTSPALPPQVVRSLYRRLYSHARRMDANPVVKVLFPMTEDLQEYTKQPNPLYVPNSSNYTKIVQEAFRSPERPMKINAAFGLLNRLRAHQENVKARLPQLLRDQEQMMATLAEEEPKRKQLYRAEVLPLTEGGSGPRFIPSPGDGTMKMVLQQRVGRHYDLSEGTVLVAHPLSSAHVDRRVMLITERTPFTTKALVLDLLFTYPLSRGNSMFPEVFWGHDVHDGGFNQIGFTMPPTAQIAVLHTLEAPEDKAEGPAYAKWRQWYNTAGREGGKKEESSKLTTAAQRHALLCKKLIPGGVLDDGTREPSLYLSKVEALPYLAELVEGKPRSTARVYWGSMSWSTAQIEAEVGNGHWIPVRVSPSFFAAYGLGRVARSKSKDTFPTAEQLRRAKETREQRYGADVSLPQVFPPDQILRMREALWDEIMFALGGEFTALVGCSNPFAAAMQSGPQILADLPVARSTTELLEADEDIPPLDVMDALNPGNEAEGEGSNHESDEKDKEPKK